MNRDPQRYAGKIVAETLQLMKKLIEDGERNTLIINNLAESYMLSKGVYPACKGYTPQFHQHPYLFGTCISVNHEIVHGLPSQNKDLIDGDIVGLDVVGLYGGWYADAAITVSVGETSDANKRLIELTEAALLKGIESIQEGCRTGDIGHSVEKHARKNELGIAKYLSGHGIGREIHCSPSIPNMGRPKTGNLIKPGSSICVEPMLTLGTDETIISADTWAIITADGSVAAHFEHTILIKDDGSPEILTSLNV